MNHVCGQCSQSFASESGYLKHTCPSQTPKPPAPVVKTTKISQDHLLAAVKAARKASKRHAQTI